MPRLSTVYLSYRLLLLLLSPVLLGHVLWLSMRNKTGRYLWQRLGFHYSRLPKYGLWFHCASVGEVNTLLPLLKHLHQKNEHLQMVITTNTITGSRIVEQQKLDYLTHSYLPIDWAFAVNRFLARVRPVSLYVMETEIWPTLFTTCSKKKIPVHIINARLSGKTTSANSWVRALLGFSLTRVTAIYSRSEDNSQAYRQLGAPGNMIATVGNLKLATATPAEPGSIENTVSIPREYVLLASTHADEELQFYTVWKKLKRNELLVIALRHPERAASIIKQLDCDNISIRSQGQPVNEQTEVFLLDTVGELKQLFQKAKLVIMGGSFVAIGGHNILEPASYNCAIITGPYMENFKDELELMLENNAIVQVNSTGELEQQMQQLLDDEAQRQTLRNNTEKLSHNAEEILAAYSELILENNNLQDR